MKCLVEKCDRPASAQKQMCEVHWHYYRVVLADKWYRNHPVPALLPNGDIQARMFSERGTGALPGVEQAGAE